MLGFPLGWEVIGVKAEDVRALSPKSQQKLEEEIEECWKQVEKTVFKSERRVPLFTEAKDSVEIEKMLEGYRKGVSALNMGSTHTNILTLILYCSCRFGMQAFI